MDVAGDMPAQVREIREWLHTLFGTSLQGHRTHSMYKLLMLGDQVLVRLLDSYDSPDERSHWIAPGRAQLPPTGPSKPPPSLRTAQTASDVRCESVGVRT